MKVFAIKSARCHLKPQYYLINTTVQQIGKIYQKLFEML